jgi:ceramide glucosyltransferase
LLHLRHLALLAPFALGAFGLLTSTVYGVMVLSAVRYFRRAPGAAPHAAFTPPLSVLKPLHGTEPDLAQHLAQFFRQDYPAYEILFCARTATDAGLAIARQVAAKHPSVPARFLVSGEPAFANAKVASLDLMAQAAQHPLLIISDSDVCVGPEYLRAVAAPFADPAVGLVTCPYRGVPAPAEAGGKRHAALWSLLEGVGMSIEMTAGVLVANMLEGMRFALGPTMAVRSACVQQMGGFRVLGEYCSDDFLLGELVAQQGYRVVLSRHAIDHIVLNTGFVDSMRHQVRWAKSTRFSRPKGHFGTALTYSMPFGVLALAGALALHWPMVAVAALAWAIATRMMIAASVGAGVVHERHLLRSVLLYPLRDLMGFAFWVASYGSHRILWRGREYLLEPGGRMRRADSGAQHDASNREQESALTL